jgi:tetratricopeptide (TPR) repeat protein
MKFFPVLFSLSLAIAGSLFSPDFLSNKLAIAQSNTKISQANSTKSSYQKELTRLIQDGDAKFQRKDMQGAIASYQKALQLAKQNQDLSLQAGILVGMGRFYDLNGEYLEAEITFNQGLKILSQLAGEPSTIEKRLAQSRWKILSLTGLGIVYTNLGEYTKASEKLQLAVLSSNQIIGKPTVLIHFEPRFKLAELYQKQEKYKEAIDILQNCRIIATQLGDRQLNAMTLTAIGTNFTKMGNLNLARQFYDQATALGNFPQEPEIANAPTRLESISGDLNALTGLFDKFLPILQKAGRSIRKIEQITSIDPNFAIVGTTANNLENVTQKLLNVSSSFRQGDLMSAYPILQGITNDMTEMSRNLKDLSVLMEDVKRNPEKFPILKKLSPEDKNSLLEIVEEMRGITSSIQGRSKQLKKN